MHNSVVGELYPVSCPDILPTGTRELDFEFESTGPPDLTAGKGTPGRMQLYLDGALVADAEAPVTVPVRAEPGRPDLQRQPRLPVTREFTSPFKFTGTIREATVDISGELLSDPEAELRAHMARQ